MTKNIYVAGPMRGYPEFNFPAFHKAAEELRKAGYTVFSPAEKDEERHGEGFSAQFPTGSLEDATATGFSLRRALNDDLNWITLHGDAIYMLKGWEKSAGAQAEWATARALGQDIFYE
jgi:hypothetical protein